MISEASPFLTLDDVLAIHAESVRRFGGTLGVRDTGLLESALAMPQATMFGEYLHASLHEQASAYLFHVVQNHPFLDGNKRAGLGAALAFLGLSGVRVVARPDELIELTLDVAQGKATKAEVAVFLQTHSKAW
jgi:death-on-curing protein